MKIDNRLMGTGLLTFACVAVLATAGCTTTGVQENAVPEVSAAPLYDTVNLEYLFMPDPLVLTLNAGGTSMVGNLGPDCVGYINADQPDYDLNYVAGSAPLGIFVEGEADSTLIVNAPDGSWRCNDDAASLSGLNPGLVFESPLSGIYNIWVGSYDEPGKHNPATLVITERDEEEWLSFDPANTQDDSIGSGNNIDFGDDEGSWANDGECDDPRFTGEGTATTLLEEDTYHDASDCRSLYLAGDIALASSVSGEKGKNVKEIIFGDNASMWANDDECDDPRFEGEGMASALLEEDRFHDAADCEALFSSNKIQLIDDEK